MWTLIRTVATVVFGVALPGVGDAASVGALELRGAAGDVDAAALVGVVAAVVLGVALEGGGNAAPRLAHELRRVASCF